MPLNRHQGFSLLTSQNIFLRPSSAGCSLCFWAVLVLGHLPQRRLSHGLHNLGRHTQTSVSSASLNARCFWSRARQLVLSPRPMIRQQWSTHAQVCLAVKTVRR